MSDTNMVTGHITQTIPVSTALDTLKALVLRNVDLLDYITDRLSGGLADIPEEDLDFLDAIRQNQFKALAEHVHVAKCSILDDLRYPHPDAYRYADGSLVVEKFKGKYGQSTYFTRYDGPRDEALKRHEEWARQYAQEVDAETTFKEIVDGVEWGLNGPEDG